MKEDLKLYMVLFLSLLVLGGLIWIGVDKRNKEHDIMHTYKTEGLQPAKKKVELYYGDNRKQALVWHNKLHDIARAEARIETQKKEAKQAKKTTVDRIQVTSKSCETNGNYMYFDFTFKNSGTREVTYFSYNIYIYDKDNNIIESEFSNWSGSLPVGAKCTDDEMIKAVDGMYRYSITIDKISTK